LSTEWLARSPIQAIQLDRAWVVAARKDTVALKVCRASIGVARALDLTPMAAGIDDAEQRNLLAALGCVQGSGDLYLESTSEAVAALKSRSTRKPPKARV
jgi:EAL domain-containing protein (putative c-di-GMP-specific phosphodiesterase class I)